MGSSVSRDVGGARPLSAARPPMRRKFVLFLYIATSVVCNLVITYLLSYPSPIPSISIPYRIVSLPYPFPIPSLSIPYRIASLPYPFPIHSLSNRIPSLPLPYSIPYRIVSLPYPFPIHSLSLPYPFPFHPLSFPYPF